MLQPRTVPLGPIDVSFRITRNPAFRWRQFTVRRLMLLVLVMAGFSILLVGRFRDPAHERINRTYAVADLVGRVHLDRRFTSIYSVAQAVQSDVPADGWARESRSVIPFPMSLSLTIDDSREGHRRIAEYIDRLRKPGP